MKKIIVQLLFWLLWLLVQSVIDDDSQLMKDARQIQQLLQTHVVAEEQANPANEPQPSR